MEEGSWRLHLHQIDAIDASISFSTKSGALVDPVSISYRTDPIDFFSLCVCVLACVCLSLDSACDSSRMSLPSHKGTFLLLFRMSFAVVVVVVLLLMLTSLSASSLPMNIVGERRRIKPPWSPTDDVQCPTIPLWNCPPLSPPGEVCLSD